RHNTVGGDLSEVCDLDDLRLTAEIGQGGLSVFGQGDALLTAGTENFDDHAVLQKLDKQIGKGVKQVADQHNANRHNAEEQSQQRCLDHLFEHDQRRQRQR